MNKYLLKIAKTQTDTKSKDQGTPLRPHHVRALKKLDETGGLVVDHGTGSGKTLLMLKAIEREQQRQPDKRALAIAPSSLVTNLDKEIKKHGLNIDKTKLDAMSYQEAVNRADELKKNKYSIAVADEAHALRNVSTQRHQELRGLIESADKRILATATPRYNHVSDQSSLINMAAGARVLPESKKEFDKHFIETKTSHPNLLSRVVLGHRPEVTTEVKNNKYLSKVLNTYTDHYDAKKDPSIQDKYPTKSERIIDVPMSGEQKALYRYAENKLPWSIKMKVRAGLPLDKRDQKSLQSFSQGIRQVSNSTRPFLPNSTHITPKIQTAVDNLEKRHGEKNFKGLVYSNYLDAGLKDYSEELTKRKIPHSIYHGGLSRTEKDRIQEEFNSGKNKVILISSAGSEGLTLKGVRLTQVIEPFWNKSKTDQVVGRAVRYESHEHLPVSQRHVDVEHYRSVFDKNALGKRPYSIDEYLHHNSESKNSVNKQVEALLE